MSDLADFRTTELLFCFDDETETEDEFPVKAADERENQPVTGGA